MYRSDSIEPLMPVIYRIDTTRLEKVLKVGGILSTLGVFGCLIYLIIYLNQVEREVKDYVNNVFSNVTDVKILLSDIEKIIFYVCNNVIHCDDSFKH